MDRRFEARKRELLADCEVSPEIFNGMVKRLEEFVEPYVGASGASNRRSMRGRMFRDCCRISKGRMPSRSPIGMTKTASVFSCLLARRRGTISR